MTDDIVNEERTFRFPAAEYIYATIRFVFWLALLGFIDMCDAPLKLVLSAVWIVAFVFRYANPGRYRAAGQNFIPLLGGPARAIRLHVFLLVMLMVLVAPWVQLLLLNGGHNAIASVNEPASPVSVLLLALLVLAITSATYPLLEEFFSRGWLFVALRERHSLHLTIAITSIIFTALHLTASPGFHLMRFVFGVALGYAVAFTRSIWTAVAMHFAWNLTIYFFQSPVSRGIQQVQYLGLTPSDAMAWTMTGIGSALCFFTLSLANRRADSGT